MPAIGCAAVVNPVSAFRLALRKYRFYDCFAADRRQASSYNDARDTQLCGCAGYCTGKKFINNKLCA